MDCNTTWSRFEDGLYPIDIEDGVLAKLSGDVLPAESELDTLLEGADDWLLGFRPWVFRLYVLGESSRNGW